MPSNEAHLETSPKQITALADPKSQTGRKRLETHAQALDAKEKGDLEGMFAAYQTAVEDRHEYEEMWAKTASLLMKHDRTNSPLEAMKDVALAAIELARDVALRHIKTEVRDA